MVRRRRSLPFRVSRNPKRPRRNGKDEHRIYVADLNAYNAGRLKGAWIVPSSDVATLSAQIIEVVGPEHEWAIHDYDDFVNLGEYPSLDDIAEVAEVYETLSDDHAEALRVLMNAEDYYAKDVAAAKAYVEENFQGTFESQKDFTYGLAEDVGIPKDALDRYFDAESFGRDVRMDLDEEGEDEWAAKLTDEELGQHYLDEGIVSDETKRQYFDYAGFTRDLFIDSYVSYRHGGKDYVFIRA